LTKGDSGIWLPAYMPKTAPDALELFRLAQDGRLHDLIVQLNYASDELGNDYVEIHSLVQRGWLADYSNDSTSPP
jgi:hypothetical protein